MMRFPVLWCAMLTVLWLAVPSLAQQEQVQEGEQAPAQAQQQENDTPSAPQRPVTVAVLDFDAADLGEDELGRQIGAILQATLAGEPTMRLVERAQIDEALEEIELSMTGLVDTDDAVRVGRLVGAQMLVTGRAFAIGNSAIITVKLIGTETSLVDGLLVRGRVQDLDELIADLATRLIERLPESAEKVLPEQEVDDRLEQLQAALEGRELPTVIVVVTEEHVGQRVRLPDPAVQTEIRHMLLLCGFEVVAVPERVVANWLEHGRETRLRHWPAQLADADVLIYGEAFSEFAGRMNNMVSAAARAEVEIIDNDTATVHFSDRATTRQVDLAEQIAARSALQQAGRELGLRILEYFDDTLPEPGADEQDAEDGE